MNESLRFIHRLIGLIEEAHGGLFKNYAALLYNCQFQKKPWWFFVKRKTHCTTLFNTIFLCDEFFTTDQWNKCRWLIHESVHLDQWKRKGSARMIAEYATKSGRERIEREAELAAALWA